MIYDIYPNLGVNNFLHFYVSIHTYFLYFSVYFQGWLFFSFAYYTLIFKILNSYYGFQHYCTSNHKKDCSSSSMVLGREDILGKKQLRIKMKEYLCLDDFNFAYVTCCLIRIFGRKCKRTGKYVA